MSIRVCPLCQAEFLDFKTTCTHCGVALVDPTEDIDFALLDDDDKVIYDLSGWPIDAQTDTSMMLAESGLPHRWDGTDLIVLADHEDAADQMLERIEDEYGLSDADDSDSDDDDDVDGGRADGDDDDDTVQATGTRGGNADRSGDSGDTPDETEYELPNWPTVRRMELVERLVELHIPHRWEGDLLVVPTVREALVDEVLDEVEGGDAFDLDLGASASAVSGEELSPAAVLSALFLAAERLRKGKVDASSYGELIDSLEGANPERPPFGIESSVWGRAIELGDELADAVADDAEGFEEIAEQLFVLLRPLV